MNSYYDISVTAFVSSLNYGLHSSISASITFTFVSSLDVVSRINYFVSVSLLDIICPTASRILNSFPKNYRLSYILHVSSGAYSYIFSVVKNVFLKHFGPSVVGYVRHENDCSAST